MYAQEQFGGPQEVFEYLGGYTHRVAISDNRLISMVNGQVTSRSDGKTTAVRLPGA